MRISHAMKFLRIAALPVVLIIIGVPALVSARAQAKPSASSAVAPIQLQTYTAPDQSASAGLPSGWKVTDAVGGAIKMSGPQGESITVGDLFVAHDGPFQLGQKGPNGAFMTMPGSARLTDKLVMVLQQIAAINGNPVPQFKFLYAVPLQMPPAMGQCGMFVVDAFGIANPAKGMGIFCSLPDDTAQFFKSVLMIGTAPSAIAVQTAPTVEAVFQSYTLAPGWSRKLLSPYTVSAAPGGSGYPNGLRSMAADDGPGLGGGDNPGPGGSGYPNGPRSMAADDGPGLGGGYNPGPGGSAGYPVNGPDVTETYSAAIARNQQVIDHGFTCADAGIMSNGSNRETPRECGGWAPNF